MPATIRSPLAGYTEGINHMFNLEPGLKSRYQTFIHFDDYTNEELTAIFENQANNAQYILADGCRELISKAMKDIPHRLAKGLGNARFVQNFFEDIKDKRIKLVVGYTGR